MAWVRESVSLARIGEYCSIMDTGERNTATAQVVTGTLEDLGRERVREAKEVLGIK
jgi:hypothetical protein